MSRDAYPSSIQLKRGRAKVPRMSFRWGATPDSRSGYDDGYTAILLTAFGSLVAFHRHTLAQTMNVHILAAQASFRQRPGYRHGALLGEIVVMLVGPRIVRISIDTQMVDANRQKYARDACDSMSLLGLKPIVIHREEKSIRQSERPPIRGLDKPLRAQCFDLPPGEGLGLWQCLAAAKG